jgi:DedD protein
MAEEQQDVETLKRRGRRRLVGAVALVLAAVIVLPMVFDSEPSGSAPPVTVRIPGENESSFNPKPPPAKPKPPAVEQKAEQAKPAAEYVIQVGVFANPDGAVKKLAGAKLPYQTEKAGNLTRVRAGPFASREAAEQALAKLKGMGFAPGAVSAR